MFSESAIIGKFKRSNLVLKKTFLFDEQKSQLNSNVFSMLKRDEKFILFYIHSNSYSWYITNKRFLIPSIDKKIDLNDLIKIDFTDLKQFPSNKSNNKELDVFTDKEKIEFTVEERSWYLIYEIFKFIIENNKKARI